MQHFTRREYMKNGTRVRLKPTPMASDEFRQKVTELVDVIAEVGACSSIGVCTLILPKGVSISGHSHPFGNGHDYLDIHESHLEVVL